MFGNLDGIGFGVDFDFNFEDGLVLKYDFAAAVALSGQGKIPYERI